MKKFLFSVLSTLFVSLSITAQEDLKVDFITPSIVRVQWSPVDNNAKDKTPKFKSNDTGVCTYMQQNVKYSIKEKGNVTTFTSAELIVELNNTTHALTFKDKKSGKVLLAENQTNPRETEAIIDNKVIYDDRTAHMEETANGMVTVKDASGKTQSVVRKVFRNHFTFTPDEGLYGLGAHMEDYMNLNGKTLYLTQHNLKAFVPMLSSTKGYGLLFDAGCAMLFKDGYIEYDDANELDYYFIKGEKMDDVVRGYHYLTGKVSMMPRYLFGYTQSKERYVSSDDILRTLKQYRDRHVPIDMIVQDWNYWPEGWGYMKMNPKYYPDPKALADSVHAMNAKLMVSIWPNPQYCPEEKDFREHGFMLEHSVYDVFNPEARKHYWKYANDEFFSKGFDAWWCDSSEPLDGDWNQIPKPVNGVQYGWGEHERRWNLNKTVLSEALGSKRSSLYSLYHSMGIYENQRAQTANEYGGGHRVVNLTRSTYAGQQRYGTIVWNGDTHASWQSFKQQIPAGLNYMTTGNPYWTVDVGSFFTRGGGRWFYKGEFPQGVKDDNYKEYYTRMFQWGTFLPMLRSHGSDTPREIWQFGEPGTTYYDAILKMINLRYTMIPYIYSMAAKQTLESYTMARALAFDFPNDVDVLDIKDEYMFGDILVCPVTDAGASSRKVYLPKDANWIDYWTGNTLSGGQWITADAPISQLPLFVKAGSIIPTTEAKEYSDAQKGLPININIYPGADAEFTLYEDEGDNYNYEKGEYSTISLKWNDKKSSLTISNRNGSFTGMQMERIFNIQVNGKNTTVNYNGKKTTIKIKS